MLPNGQDNHHIDYESPSEEEGKTIFTGTEIADGLRGSVGICYMISNPSCMKDYTGLYSGVWWRLLTVCFLHFHLSMLHGHFTRVHYDFTYIRSYYDGLYSNLTEVCIYLLNFTNTHLLIIVV